MKRTIALHEFCDFFRAVYPNTFSCEGLQLLYDHLEQLGEDTDEEIEFDGIGYSEDSFEDFASSYDVETDRDAIEEKLENNSTLVGFTSGDTVVYQDF